MALLLSSLLGVAPFIPPPPILVNDAFVQVGSEANQRGITKTSPGDTLITWAATMYQGVQIPWVVTNGRLIFTVAGNGQIISEMEGYDRSWQLNASGFAWCVSNVDGNSPIISMSGEMAGPT